MTMPGPPSDMDDMVLIVTGAGQGIGRAIAEEAVRKGVRRLHLTDVDADALAGVAAALGGKAEVRTLVEDLGDPSAPERIVASGQDAFGRIDGLVNAAAMTTRGGFEDGTADIWNRLFAVNARAPFLMMQAVIRDMVGRGAAGAIVNIQSTNAHCGAPDLSIYAATKGALQTLTKNAANAYLHRGIRVNGINLGWTLTPSEDRLQSRLLGEDWAERAGEGRPLGRLLLPDEAARMAVHLLSLASAPMTGVSVDLDQAVLGAPP